MKDRPIEQVRNVVLMGHTGSGKTALTDALLFKLGMNDRLGSTDDGSSMGDWTDEEKGRKITLLAKPFDVDYTASQDASTRLVFMDTPGYADFFGQAAAASAVADACLLVVDAVAGIQVGTQRAWRRCVELGLPRGIVISGLDRENADFAGLLETIRTIWGPRCLPVSLPVAGQSVADVLGSDAPEAGEWKNGLLEAAAESDDALLEKYLGGETLSPEEIDAGLRGRVLAESLFPVFALSAKESWGLTELLDGLTRFFPSPADRPPKDASGEPVDPRPEAPFLGQVWRSVNDPFVGQLTFIRVWSGTLKAEGEMQNLSKEQKERIGALYLARGKKQETIEEAHAGDIVALAKLKHTTINDTVGAPGTLRHMPEIAFPHPVMSMAVAPKTQGDEDKLGTGLQRLCEEDRTLHYERRAETHETVLSGMGDVHIDTAIERLRHRSNVEVVLSTPKVPYKETVTGQGEGHYRHKKQSGGRGQYGEVFLRIEPRSDDEEEWFFNQIVGGAIPSGFIPAIQKGLHEGMQAGALAGHPVTRVKVSVYDGSYHDVDSSEIAFKIAAARAFREAMKNAKPVLLEPIMRMRILIPDQYMGDVTGDLNHRRGRILGMGSEDGLQVIEAEAPQAEIFQYCSQLRSITGGRGTFEATYARYETVPANVAQKVIAEAEKSREEHE